MCIVFDPSPDPVLREDAWHCVDAKEENRMQNKVPAASRGTHRRRRVNPSAYGGRGGGWC